MHFTLLLDLVDEVERSRHQPDVRRVKGFDRAVRRVVLLLQHCLLPWRTFKGVLGDVLDILIIADCVVAHLRGALVEQIDFLHLRDDRNNVRRPSNHHSMLLESVQRALVLISSLLRVVHVALWLWGLPGGRVKLALAFRLVVNVRALRVGELTATSHA